MPFHKAQVPLDFELLYAPWYWHPWSSLGMQHTSSLWWQMFSYHYIKTCSHLDHIILKKIELGPGWGASQGPARWTSTAVPFPVYSRYRSPTEPKRATWSLLFFPITVNFPTTSFKYFSYCSTYYFFYACHNNWEKPLTFLPRVGAVHVGNIDFFTYCSAWYSCLACFFFPFSFQTYCTFLVVKYDGALSSWLLLIFVSSK